MDHFTLKIKRVLPSSNSILESFIHPSQKPFSIRLYLLFAKQHHDIANDNKRLIKYCRKFLLFSNNEAWKKKQTESCFRVTIGSFDGAEVCKLVGIYTWCFLAKLIDKNDCGLYRNARLLTLRNVNGQEIDQMRKKYHKIIQRYWTCH